MHEWALAETVIAAASSIAAEQGFSRITEVTVRVGQLQQVERGILRFALLQLKPAGFENTRFRIISAKTKLKCRVCGYEWLFQKRRLSPDVAEAIHFLPEVAHTYIKCPRCGSPDFEVIQGRGIWLETVKGVK
jgi:hydrogenase nickel incorporation protein HypA/HybF